MPSLLGDRVLFQFRPNRLGGFKLFLERLDHELRCFRPPPASSEFAILVHFHLDLHWALLNVIPLAADLRCSACETSNNPHQKLRCRL